MRHHAIIVHRSGIISHNKHAATFNLAATTSTASTKPNQQERILDLVRSAQTKSTVLLISLI
jgi:hypothetical protein